MYIVVVLDRNGGFLREENYELNKVGLAQLHKDWPYSIYVGDGMFEAWAGGRS